MAGRKSLDRGHLSIIEGIQEAHVSGKRKDIKFNLGVHWASLEKSKYFGGEVERTWNSGSRGIT